MRSKPIKVSTAKEYLSIKSEYDTAGCLNYTGALFRDGYGRVDSTLWSKLYKVYTAHQLMYIVVYGDYDRNLCVCHTCDNRKCINPNHLWLGTHKENRDDAVNKGRLIIDGENNPNYKGGVSYNKNEYARSLHKKHKEKNNVRCREWYWKNKLKSCTGEKSNG